MYSELYRYARLLFPEERLLQKRIQELRHTQWLSPEQLQELQLVKLKRLLEHAYANVPFYKQRFDEADVHPRDLQTLGDLERFPIVTKDDVRQNLESMVDLNYPRERLITEHTSGSTGTSLKFYFSKERIYWSWAAYSRLFDWWGIEKGSKQAHIMGREFLLNPTVSQRARMAIRREKWLNCYDMSEDKMRAYTDALRRFQPEVIHGYSSGLWLLAQYIEKNNIKGVKARVALGGVDKVYDFERELIERAFQCPLVDHYSARETGQISGQCTEGSMHIWSELHYLELINEGKPVAPGESGEVVITELENYATPLIRYALGDVASLEDKACSCGRGLPVIKELMGRKFDFFSSPDGKIVTGGYFLNYILKEPAIRKVRVHQPSLERIDIYYEAENDMHPASIEKMQDQFRSYMGGGMQICFNRVDNIPPSASGKYSFTSSDVPVNLAEYK
jgi:phenylacetate-CoA ligase